MKKGSISAVSKIGMWAFALPGLHALEKNKGVRYTCTDGQINPPPGHSLEYLQLNRRGKAKFENSKITRIPQRLTQMLIDMLTEDVTVAGHLGDVSNLRSKD